MSGGAWEYVMANMVNANGLFYANSSGFTVVPDSKYYDSYSYSTSQTTHSRGKLGDAIKETLKTYGYLGGAWYKDCTGLQVSNIAWLERGGDVSGGTDTGVFHFNRYNGDANNGGTTRCVLVLQ